MDAYVELESRIANTSGWYTELDKKEALPVKTLDGRIVRTIRTVKNDHEDHNESQQNVIERKTHQSRDDGVENDEKAPNLKSTTPDVHKIADINKIKVIIGNICTEVIADPQYGLKKKHDMNEKGEPRPKLTDLFQFLRHPILQARELATLSCFLIFKDICPGYKIRTRQEFDDSIQLKKETKQLRDFELAMLAMYQIFLKYLDETIVLTLGKSITTPIQWNSNTKLGLSAIRIQCELCRCLLHFNYRSMLLNSIISYGSQKEPMISTICCDTLQHILSQDHEGEASYEIVKIMASVMMSSGFNISDNFLDVLKYVKLGVHADDAKDVRKVAKRERRKRRRQDDDIETGLLEADAVSSKSISRRFQADCLHETSLIYFRVIKMKNSFKLLPSALEGLARISHLINIDTVQDLLQILKAILTASTPPAPTPVRILCIHCAMKTLSGPGKELQADDDVYVDSLRRILEEVPMDYTRWDLLLESVEICVVKYREMKNSLVMTFVKRLLLLSPHLPVPIASVALALTHSILLRYPRARVCMSMLGQGGSGSQDEDVMADFAMKSLREEANTDDSGDGDGSWILPLLLYQSDKRLRPVITALTSRDILPLPLRLHEAKSDVRTLDSTLDSAFKTLPERLIPKVHFVRKAGYSQSSVANGHDSKKQKQKEFNHKKPRK